MNLLATSLTWLPDVIFFGVLLIGFLVGFLRGFVKGICKIAGTLLAILCAFFFCMPLHHHLESWFGFTTLLNNATAAPFGEWLSVVICFVGLFVVIKLLCWVIGIAANKLVKVSKALNLVDHLLGGLLGAAAALFVLLIILMICHWTGLASVYEFLQASSIVGKIFTSDWFRHAMNLPGRLLSGTAALIK